MQPYDGGFDFWVGNLGFIDLLKVTAEQGDVATVISSKFIPSHYGKNMQFLRKIWNAGWLGWARLIFLYTTCVIYPLAVSQNISDFPSLSEKSIVLFIFISTAIALVQIRSLLTQAFDTRKTLDLNSE